MSVDSLRDALAGRYAIDRELGRGGMGVVSLARDIALDRLVALKVLPSELARNPETRERFLREARTAAQLSHPNIVPVHHADAVGDLAFFAMGYVDGENLGERVRARGALPVAEAVRYLREAAWALAYAHARGVVHRDIKPENLLLDRATGRVMVTDFGIARDAARADGLTQTGHVLGTVHYMSPEQVAGEPLDGRSDLYALGVVGFQLLSARLPFEGDVASAILVAHATRLAPSLASIAPGVPRQVAAVVDACLAKAPEDRPATGEALADALGSAVAAAEQDAAALPPTADARLTEAQALALWQRAAQLQADALRRVDTTAIAPTLAQGGSRTGSPAAPRDGTPAEGYRLAHVQAAAIEAGISQQFVALALAELGGAQRGGTAGTALSPAPIGGWQERRATQLLGTAERSCAATRVIPAPPSRVLQALGQVLQQSPFELVLGGTVGGHPLDGGVLVFDLTGAVSTLGVASGLNLTWYGTRLQLEARSLQVTLREAPGIPGSTEVTMYTDLRPGVRRNVNASAWLSGTLGATGGGLAAAIGAKALVALGALGIALPAVGAGAVIAAGTMALYRSSYRGAVRRAEDEMGRALDAVAGSLRALELFGASAPPQRPLRIGGLRGTD
ncbi:MAG: serine/threonine protein kinase [Gemmatimonadetes bacterium]|nr:serine/threonine protein kinase [Gemmatimonadota bacterium]